MTVPKAVAIVERTKEDSEALRQRFNGIPTGVTIPDAVVITERTLEDTQAIRQHFSKIPPNINVAVPDPVKLEQIVTNIYSHS